MSKTLVYDIETNGLKPHKGDRIICIGVHIVEDDKTTVIYEEDEKDLVEKFMRFCGRNGFDEVVGYNISFDDRFIFAKCMQYEINANGFFTDTYHVDLMSKMKTPVSMYSSNDPGSLDDWIGLIFDRDKLESNGDVPELYESGELERIKEYCRDDVLVTADLYRRLDSVLG